MFVCEITLDFDFAPVPLINEGGSDYIMETKGAVFLLKHMADELTSQTLYPLHQSSSRMSTHFLQ